MDGMIEDMQKALQEKKDAAAEGEEDADPHGEKDFAEQGGGGAKPKDKAKGKVQASSKAATPEPKGKANGKAQASSKAATPVKHAPSGSTPIMKKPASCAGVSGKRPRVEVEHTRNQVLARTGLTGPGQTKTFAIDSKGEEHAKKKARAWLKATCASQGIDY